ncbi:MAG: radical SAM protein [bacterium]
MHKIIINENNYQKLEVNLAKRKSSRKKGLEIFFEPVNNKFDFEIIKKTIDLLLQYENFFQIRIRDLPYCLINETEDRLILNDFSKFKKHLRVCRGCRYQRRCGGVLKKQAEFYRNKIKPVKDLPREVMIEIEPKCNFNCIFCFNQNSFALHGREQIKSFSCSYLKKIIKAIALSGVKIVRFTGGEPMLRKDIWELMDYAKLNNLKIRLNTNGSLISNKDIVKKLNQYISSILLPIESYDNNIESKLTGCKDSLNKKVKAVKLLKKYGKMTLRAGTVATKENIRDLDKIFNLVINNLEMDDWELYRPIPTKKNRFPINRKDLRVLIDKLIQFQRLTKRTFSIVNAIPFCAYRPEKVKQVSIGALSIDGHIRYAIDPRGFAKPDYYIDKNIGDPLDILGCWNNPFMKKMRNLKFVPKECNGCQYLQKCRGGSRFAAKIAFGSFKAKDPLARY